MAKTFYTNAPESEGTFTVNGTIVSDDFKRGVSLFRFVQKDDGTAEFGLSKKQSAIKQALANKTVLGFACAVENPDLADATNIIVLENGKAKLQPNGDWVVVKKSIIKYSLGDEDTDESTPPPTETKLETVPETVPVAIPIVANRPANMDLQKNDNDNATASLETKLIIAPPMVTNADIADISKRIEMATPEKQDDAIEPILPPPPPPPIPAIPREQIWPGQKPPEPKQQKQKPTQQKQKTAQPKQTQTAQKQTKSPVALIAAAIGAVVICAGAAVVVFMMLTNTKTDTKWYTKDRNASEFTISTAQELEGLAQIVNGTWGKRPARDNFAGKTINLAGDVDLSNYDNWIPIGNHSADSNNTFSGTFDGGGYLISNLTINRPNADRQGLFGHIGNGGSVKRLGLDGVNVNGRNFVGAIAGIINTESSVTDCHAAGDISGIVMVGGIAGAVSGNSNVANSYSAGVVSGDTIAGGVAGQVLSNSGVANSYSNSTISGHSTTGGVVGNVRDNSHVIGSYSTGTINGNIMAGGVAGSVDINSQVTNSHSTGAVSGRSTIGGVVGHVRNNSSVTGSHSASAVSGDIAIGGVAGSVDLNSQITHSHSTGTVIGNRDIGVGGVAGQVRRNSSVANCYSTGIISGNGQVGGIAGLVLDSSSVANSYSAGAVSGTGSSIGGVAGGVEKRSRVINSAALNPEVKGTGANTGRIVGEFSASTLSNNIAFAGMKNNAGNTEWGEKSATARGGVDITETAISYDDTIGGRFTSANGWTTRGGKLPGLNGATVDPPGHLGIARQLPAVQDSVVSADTVPSVTPPPPPQEQIAVTPPAAPPPPSDTKQAAAQPPAPAQQAAVSTPPTTGTATPPAKQAAQPPAPAQRTTPSAPPAQRATPSAPAQTPVESKQAAPVQPPPQQAAATPPSTGGRTRASIRQVIVQNISTVRAAYDRRLRDVPGLEGKIDVKFSINEFGVVISAQVVGSTLGDPELERTIVDRVKSWNFGRIDKPDDVTEVTYPFVLSP